MGAGVIFAAGGRVHGLVVVTLLFLWPVNWLSARLLGRLAYEARNSQVVAALPVRRRGVWVRIIVRCRRPQAHEIYARPQGADGLRFVTDEALETGAER